MARWIIIFVVVFAILCILYSVVRLRTTPEDEIKERDHEAADRRTGPAPPRR